MPLSKHLERNGGLRNGGLNGRAVLRAIGIGLLGWLGFDLFVLVMMLRVRPDNTFTWCTIALAPLSCLLVAGPIYLLYSLLRSMPLVQALNRLIQRIPLLLRMLFAIAAGTAALMLISVHGRKPDSSSWPLSNPFAVARWAAE